jgi:hypothetical protein
MFKDNGLCVAWYMFCISFSRKLSLLTETKQAFYHSSTTTFLEK